MELNGYEFKANGDFSRFYFNSVGPRGVIKKAVSYQVLYFYNKLPVVNLAFGDWDEGEQKINDSVVSDNKDRDKVLATVASTILTYLEMHGKCLISAEGSTPARTRLYQMGINAHRIEIESIFFIFGLDKREWITFEPGRNFQAFLVYKK
jgi:hypothetical protein